jgi:hypothetical protein
MAHVFISYAPENFEYADLLVRWLEGHGFTPYIDSESEEMPAGKDWRQEIDDAIRDAFALIAVMSPEAKQFEYVTYEWTFALGVGVRVIPIVIEATELPPRLRALRHLDFTNRVAYPWDGLFNLLREIQLEYNFTQTSLTQVASKDVRQIVADLYSDDPNKLKSAVERLSKIDDWAARESLVQVLRHPVKTVRTAVALALAHTGDVRTIPNLIEAMRSNSKDIQWAALRALIEVDPDAVLELILDALRDDTRRTLWTAARVDKGIPRHVFMSYSRRDAPYMLRLRDDLQDEQIIVWTDEALTPGTTSWQIAIENAIENAGCMVVIFSPDAKKSEWVRAEMDYAKMHNITIFPALVRGDEKTAVPFGFTSAQWADLRHKDKQRTEIQRLVMAIHQHLRRFTRARNS